MTGSLMDPLHLLINKCSLVISRKILTYSPSIVEFTCVATKQLNLMIVGIVRLYYEGD